MVFSFSLSCLPILGMRTCGYLSLQSRFSSSADPRDWFSKVNSFKHCFSLLLLSLSFFSFFSGLFMTWDVFLFSRLLLSFSLVGQSDHSTLILPVMGNLSYYSTGKIQRYKREESPTRCVSLPRDLGWKLFGEACGLWWGNAGFWYAVRNPPTPEIFCTRCVYNI